jgi:hypothetical protein
VILPVTRSQQHQRPAEFNLFDMGIVTGVSPVDRRLMGRASLFARNVDWDRRTIASRGGTRRVAENSPGAVPISNFEAAETWSATGSASVSADTVQFVPLEAGGAGLQGRQLNIGTGGAGTFTGSIKRVGLALDLSGATEDVFPLWIFPVTLPSSAGASYTVTLIFRSSGGNQFEAVIASSTGDDLGPEQAQYARPKRMAFTETGVPNWASITEIEISVSITVTAIDGITLTFDNLYRAPGRGQDLIAFKRETDSTYKGSQDIYAVVDGRLYRLNKPSERWIDMGLYFNPSADVNHAVMNDRLYLFDGVSTNIKVMPDGTTVYRNGILALTSPVSAVPSTLGGSLQSGTHRFAITYYSTITGVESAPHTREGQEVVVVGPTGSIQYTGIAASSDPQVTHIRIYRKSPFMTLFQRVSANTDGELVNGASTFLDTLPDSSLGDELDPDLDAPGPFKLLAPFPGLGIMMGVFAATPTAINFSSLNPEAGTVENWPVSNIVAAGRDDNEVFTALHFDGYRMQLHRANIILAAYQVAAPVLIEVRSVATSPGARSQKSIVDVDGRSFYGAGDGIYALGPEGLPQKQMSLAQPTWNAILDPTGVSRACAVHNRRRFQYRLYFRSLGMGQNDLCWNLHHQSRTVDSSQSKGLGQGSVAASGIDNQSALAATQVTLEGGEVREWILSADGQVYQIDTGTTDDGHAIDARHRTTLISPASGARLHRFQYLDPEVEQSSDETFQVKVWYDFSNRAPVGTPPASLLSEDATPLGLFILGQSYLGGDYGNWDRLRLPVQRARRIMLEFRHKGRASFNLYSFHLWSSVVGR